jgi:hypothetical protein
MYVPATDVAVPCSATVVANTLLNLPQWWGGHGLVMAAFDHHPVGSTRGGGMHFTGDGSLPVDLTLTWDGPLRLSVEHVDGVVTVVAHAGLSEANVEAACMDLDRSVGQAVLSAWRNSLKRPR